MIYFVQSGDAVKIGYAANPEARVAQLQCSTPHPVTILGLQPGSPGDEKALHKRFARYNIRREWFRMSEDIRAFIASDCRPYAPRMDGRRQRRAGRTVAFNFMVKPGVKDNFAAACKALGISYTQGLERALLTWLDGANQCQS